jgi:aspartate/methionine/tyrosine aminotransferase
VIPWEDLAAAAELIAETDAWVLSDEVYWRLLHEGVFASIATEPGMLERTVVLDSCSKTFAMTGWRCGFAAVPEALVDPLTRFFVNTTSCVPPFVQQAAKAALTGPMDSVEAMAAEFRVRRDLVVEGLNALPGVSCRTSAGAFYAFPNVKATGIAADELAERLLGEMGVAVLAGSAFGEVGADNVRISYANSQENLCEALDRIRGFLAANR